MCPAAGLAAGHAWPLVHVMTKSLTNLMHIYNIIFPVAIATAG